MSKELTHRGDELKTLGWTVDDVSRYVELWDYRQRWGAINLEREERQFLRKAESALPTIVKSKSTTKKPLREKAYFKWLSTYLEEINFTELKHPQCKSKRGLWSVFLEEELFFINYFQPVLGLPDTIKAREMNRFREDIINDFIDSGSVEIEDIDINVNSLIENVSKKGIKNCKPLRTNPIEKNMYPIIENKSIDLFRDILRDQLPGVIKNLLPSLADSDKLYTPEKLSQ